jgi:hypothetical protein
VTVLERLRAHDLAGWEGLPEACAPAALGAQGDPADWAVHPLGDEFAPASFTLLDLEGYVRPRVSVRDNRVVLFDATHPQVDFPALMAGLGDPEERHDYVHGLLPVGDGEWVYAARGLTAFVNPSSSKLFHIALYAPTTPTVYRARLRPHLAKTLRPIPTPRHLQG